MLLLGCARHVKSSHTLRVFVVPSRWWYQYLSLEKLDECEFDEVHMAGFMHASFTMQGLWS